YDTMSHFCSISLHDALPIYPAKDSLFLDALQALERQYPDLPPSAQVTYRIIQFLYSNRLAAPSKKTDLNALRNRLEVLITRFPRSEEHTSELQSRENLVCRL